MAKPPPKQLTPLSSVLVDWESLKTSSFLSIMPEEGTQRIGLIEEYLWEYLTLLKMRNNSKAEVIDRERTSFFLDEAEERNFMIQDGTHFALNHFILETEHKEIEVFCEWEEAARQQIVKAYNEYVLMTLVVREEIFRMHIVTEAFDSVFLKVCQVNPHWMWRKLKFIEVEQWEAMRKAERVALAEEEKASRRVLTSSYREQCIVILEMLAKAEKAGIFENHRVIFVSTCRDTLEDSAIKIQAAWRGCRSRRNVKLW